MHFFNTGIVLANLRFRFARRLVEEVKKFIGSNSYIVEVDVPKHLGQETLTQIGSVYTLTFVLGYKIK
jgi:hypothetical protein